MGLNAGQKLGPYEILGRLGAGEDTLLLESGESKNVEGWSPDGRLVAFNRVKPGGFSEIWFLPMEGAGRKPFPPGSSRTSQGELRFSPNGKWVAYVSGVSQQREVFVQPFSMPRSRGLYLKPSSDPRGSAIAILPRATGRDSRFPLAWRTSPPRASRSS
jgi:Tol biopolymer transport system component